MITETGEACYELDVLKSQFPILDVRVLTPSVEGRKPGVEGVGDDGSCACGGSRCVLAVIGVSSPDVLAVCMDSAGSGLACGDGNDSPRTALSARTGSGENMNDGMGLGKTPCKMLDCNVPGVAGVE